MLRLFRALLGAVLLFGAIPSHAQINLLSNSYFTFPDVPPGGSIALSPGDDFGGWEIVNSGPQASPGVAVALYDRAFYEPGVVLNPYSGEQVLLLSQRDRFARIRQTVTTIVGDPLKLVLALGDAEGGVSNGEAAFNIVINGLIMDGISFRGNNPGGIDWRLFEYNFQAMSSTTSIEINSNGSTNFQGVGYAALLSNVPEPQSWMMMIIGFGMLGVTQRRKACRADPHFQYADHTHR